MIGHYTHTLRIRDRSGRFKDDTKHVDTSDFGLGTAWLVSRLDQSILPVDGIRTRTIDF